MMITSVTAALTAYLLGSIPFGFIVAKSVQKIDIREHGSRNVGATNVFRVVGKKWGILVLALDAAKGFLAVVLPMRILFPESGSVPLELLWGICAILGHSFPVWLSLRGGKGVATSLGVFLAIAPVSTLLAFLCFILVFVPTHIISISSICAALLFPVIVFFLESQRPGFSFLLLVSMVLTLFILFTHRTNIRRLLKREEKRLF